LNGKELNFKYAEPVYGSEIASKQQRTATSGLMVPKADPKDVVRQVLDALEAGQDEVLADDVSRQVKQGLSAGAYLSAPKR
jgi:hypothetical protein